MTDLLKTYAKWPGLRRVCRITRERQIHGKQSVQTLYAITSLSAHRADARDLPVLSRAHWGIENRLFCVRDMTFREDACRVRKGCLPQVMAALRNTAITIIRRIGLRNIVEGIELFMEDRHLTAKIIRYGRIE